MNIVCIAAKLDASQPNLLNHFFCSKQLLYQKNIDRAIPSLVNKFGNFVTVETYQDLHTLKKLI